MLGKIKSLRHRHRPLRTMKRLSPRLEVLEDRSLLSVDLLVNDNGGLGTTGSAYFTQSETTIVASGNTVVIGFNDSGSNNGANKFTGFAYSADGGLSFTDGGTLPTNPNGDAGDPVLARNETTGRIFFATLQTNGSGIDVFHSDDGGVTWSLPAQGAPGKTSGQDKDWIAVDNFAGSGNGNVYLVERDFGTGNGIYFFRSTDGGATFGPNGGTLITSASASQGAFVAVGPDHTVYVFWYAGSEIQMSKSTDQGVTFSAPVTVASGLVGGVNGNLLLTGLRQGTTTYATFRTNEFPQAAVNPVTGAIYVTYANHGAGNDKADIFLVQSTDGGTTFDAPIQVNDDATITDQWFPTVAVTPDGANLGIFYYSRQEDPLNNNLFKYYGRIADISAATLAFQPGFAISDVASLPEFGRDTVVNSTYMGDYNQAVATPGAFHVVWSDNRADLGPPPVGNPNKDPNVYYEKIYVRAPAIIATAPTGNLSPPVSSYTVTFDRPMSTDPANFTLDDITAFTGQGGIDLKPTITGIQPLSASQFRIDFASAAATGSYTIVIGPGIVDASGKQMDSAFTGTFGITGPRVTASAIDWNYKPKGLPATTKVTITFDRSIDVTSITPSDVVLTSPQGARILATSTSAVAGSNGTQFDVIFPKQSQPKQNEAYALAVGPDIRDLFGNPMDQDGDLLPGEVPQDQYRATITRGGITSVVGMAASGALSPGSPLSASLTSAAGPSGSSASWSASLDEQFHTDGLTLGIPTGRGGPLSRAQSSAMADVELWAETDWLADADRWSGRSSWTAPGEEASLSALDQVFAQYVT